MIDPEWLKLVSANLLDEEGVRLLLHSWVVGTLVEDGAVRGVLFESKQGRRAVLAKVVVDASGDLDVCAFAGARVPVRRRGPAARASPTSSTA